MKKEITIHDKKVAYTIKKSKKARRMRLAVYCDGAVVVTTPFGLRENIAEKFIKEKAKWLLKKIEYYKQFQGKLVVKYRYEDCLKHKENALFFAVDRVEKFNKIYKLKFNKINIKNQKTRWGSCSKKGNLNFNYKILFLPSHLADYIIVHEVCHIKEFNHSKKFWSLVAETVPNYLEIRKELKENTLSFG